MKKSFFLGLAILMMWFMCVNGGYIECGGSGLYCPDSDTCCLDNGSGTVATIATQFAVQMEDAALLETIRAAMKDLCIQPSEQ
mgnify:CR=1 FL=1